MKYKSGLTAMAAVVVLFAAAIYPQNKPQVQTPKQTAAGSERTVLVTAYPRGEKELQILAKLQNSDFAVLENKRTQRIISVKNSSEAPLHLAVVVQDNLDWRVNSEIKILKDFIRNLPAGSRVMTAYLTIGGAIVTQELTPDLRQAADSLRVIRSGSFPPVFSPYEGIETVLRHFEDKTVGRKLVLVVSDGLDMSGGYIYASPYFSISLDRAIKEAQRRAIAVFTIYAPSEDRKPYGRFAVNYGQGSLIRLAGETGGESYSSFDFINFSPFLEDFKQTFSRQWLITYRSSTVGTRFRQIEVTTDFDLHLLHLAGYAPLKAK